MDNKNIYEIYKTYKIYFYNTEKKKQNPKLQVQIRKKRIYKGKIKYAERKIRNFKRQQNGIYRILENKRVLNLEKDDFYKKTEKVRKINREKEKTKFKRYQDSTQKRLSM